MTKVKRILSIVFVLAIMASLCIIPASAAEARAVPTCGNCGKAMTLVSTTYGSWNTTSTRNCTHYANGRDEEQERTITRRYECASCEKFKTVKSTQYRTNCAGYN